MTGSKRQIMSNPKSVFATVAIPARLPYKILANIFYYLLPRSRDLLACMLACKHWYGYLAEENCDIWRIFCEDLLPQAALNEAPCLFSALSSYKAKAVAFLHAWNPLDCSRNVYVKLNGFTLHRNPIAQSTDGARGKIGFNSGRHSWELWFDGPLGTVAAVGVATKHAALQCHGYLALLGSDDQGWSWNLVDNSLLHNGKTESSYPAMNNPPKYQVGERIRVILDCDAHLLYFEKDYEFYGVAFRNLPPVKLYPCASAVYGNTEITMIYLGTPVDG